MPEEAFFIHTKRDACLRKRPNMSSISPICDKVKRKTFAKRLVKQGHILYNEATFKGRNAARERQQKQKEVSPMNDEIFEQDGLDEGVMEDVIEMTDEEGNTILFSIIDYFFYNGEEYAILTDSNDEEDDDEEGIACYVMKIVATTDESGEELEEFVPVEDQALEAKLMEIASMKLNSDEEADDED